MKSLVIIGKRWFRKTYGNTYSSCVVVIDGEEHKLGRTGGYGEYYLQMGIEFLAKNGHIPESVKGYGLRIYCEENNISFYSTVSDVTREKDL